LESEAVNSFTANGETWIIRVEAIGVRQHASGRQPWFK